MEKSKHNVMEWYGHMVPRHEMQQLNNVSDRPRSPSFAASWRFEACGALVPGGVDA